MPRTIKVGGKPRSVATEAELLDFANAIRQAGGAGVIEALLPSVPASPKRCLIANALNFGCSVETTGSDFADGSVKWIMVLPHNLTADQRKALGQVKGVRLRHGAHAYDEACYYLTLPKHIGNAAGAFDDGAAFRNYVDFS